MIVTATETNVTLPTVTNSAGYYRVTSLVPGKYQVHFEASGFSPLDMKDIVVPAGQTIRADAQLTARNHATDGGSLSRCGHASNRGNGLLNHRWSQRHSRDSSRRAGSATTRAHGAGSHRQRAAGQQFWFQQRSMELSPTPRTCKGPTFP